MAGSWLSIKLYWVTICVASLYFFHRYRSRALDLTWIPFFALTVTFAVMVWPRTLNVGVGLLHLAIAGLATIVGRGGSIAALKDLEKSARWAAIVVALLIAIQIPICAMQLLGFDLFQPDAITELAEGSRANGTLAHPGNIGKVSLLLLMILFWTASSEDRATRRWSYFGIASAVATAVMSGSRANFLGIVLAVALWALIQPGRGAGARRLVLILGLAIVGAASASYWEYRTETGSSADFREHLLEVGWQQFLMRPLQGLGPNNYIQVVQNFDFTAGWGLPVHNVPVFILAELGVVCGLAFFFPFVIRLLQSLSRVFSAGRGADAARAYLSVTVGLIPVIWTGWGMLAETLPLWMMLTAWTGGLVAQIAVSGAHHSSASSSKSVAMANGAR